MGLGLGFRLRLGFEIALGLGLGLAWAGDPGLVVQQLAVAAVRVRHRVGVRDRVTARGKAA